MAKPEKVEDVTKFAPSQQVFLTKVAEDEPIFILRGRDKLAVATIQFWIQQARVRGVHHEKIEAALAHLEMFMRWQSQSATKLPD